VNRRDELDRLPHVTPGEVLREEFLVPLGLSARALVNTETEEQARSWRRRNALGRQEGIIQPGHLLRPIAHALSQ
jgi:hypothetical protein